MNTASVWETASFHTLTLSGYFLFQRLTAHCYCYCSLRRSLCPAVASLGAWTGGGRPHACCYVKSAGFVLTSCVAGLGMYWVRGYRPSVGCQDYEGEWQVLHDLMHGPGCVGIYVCMRMFSVCGYITCGQPGYTYISMDGVYTVCNEPCSVPVHTNQPYACVAGWSVSVTNYYNISTTVWSRRAW